MALSTFIWRLVLNIADMLLGIIAYAAVFFVLWGGFNIVFSSGDPAKLAKGKSTISNALMGMALALTSGGIVRFVNDTLGSNVQNIVYDPYDNPIPVGVNTDRVWANATSALMMVAAFGAILMPQATAKAKNTIIFALVGAIIMFLTGVIIRTVFTVVTGDDM
jgi:hypothetical protein